MTTYEIYMHYFNDAIGKCVTNVTDCQWYPCETKLVEYDKSKYKGQDDYLTSDKMDQTKLKNEKEALETCYISGDNKDSERDINVYEDLVINNSYINNPKYDMIFIWDGLGFFDGPTDPTHKVHNQLYFDKMKRVTFRPWFFHSTYHSLKAALDKAEKLVDMFGQENVMVCKNVALDKYIDIV